MQSAIMSLVIVGNVWAQDIHINGTISHTIKEQVVSNHNQKIVTPFVTRDIKLLNIQLSDKAKKSLIAKTHNAVANQLTNKTLHGKLPASIQLGMNDVPVLDQGEHGTCVTFAATAAFDAIIGQGDYISQLCQLQLGNYLSTNAYGYSGWDGSLGRWVLSQMETFGVVSKEVETTVGCGGLHEYPNKGPIPETSISLKKYYKISESMAKIQALWLPILDIYQATERFDTNKTLADVKASLVHGDRVIFAVLLLDFDLGMMGAAGKKSDTYDSWVLTPEIARDIFLNPSFGGHEMIITGYDDEAIATDDEGRTYKGLLTLRNSWGENVGDHGNFYMSYEYFKLLAMEAQRIRSVESMFG